MKVYSPSEVEKYMRCPMLWALGKSGWRPNNFSYGEVTAAIGTGIHKGAYELHRAIMTQGSINLPDYRDMAIEAALEAAKGDIRSYLDAGCFPMVKVEDWETRIETQVPSGVKAYIEQFPLDPNWTVIGAEESFELERGEKGYKGKIDIIVETENGNAVIDIKTKQPFKSVWFKDQFIDSFQWSWQMYHYTWLSRQMLEGSFDNFYLAMIEMKPKPKVTLHPFKIQKEYMDSWLHTVQEKWREMQIIEEGLMVPSISNNHYAFGQRCPMYRACLDFKLDEQLMQSEYVRLEI